MTTPGIRNNNPGNIRRSPSKWQGMADDQPDNRFVKFISPEMGIRALVKILLAYQDRYECRNILQIVNRYAPASENDVEAYIKALCSATGIDRGQPLDVRDYQTCRKLVKGIIRHENGQRPYPEFVIEEGMALAGVVKV